MALACFPLTQMLFLSPACLAARANLSLSWNRISWLVFEIPNFHFNSVTLLAHFRKAVSVSPPFDSLIWRRMSDSSEQLWLLDTAPCGMASDLSPCPEHLEGFWSSDLASEVGHPCCHPRMGSPWRADGWTCVFLAEIKHFWDIWRVLYCFLRFSVLKMGIILAPTSQCCCDD